MRQLSKRLSAVVFVALVGLAATAMPAQAAPSRHRIDVDTSSLAGETVHLFFAASGYNNGPGSAIDNLAVVSNFTTDATLLPPATPFGLTTGDLPSTLNLPFDHENGGINARAQYDIEATLANSISFDVTLSGDQLEGTNVVPYAGFEFSLYQGNFFIWLDPSGFAAAEVYQADGVLTTEADSHIIITPLPIPEPATLSLFALSGGAMLLRRGRN